MFVYAKHGNGHQYSLKQCVSVSAFISAFKWFFCPFSFFFFFFKKNEKITQLQTQNPAPNSFAHLWYARFFARQKGVAEMHICAVIRGKEWQGPAVRR